MEVSRELPLGGDVKQEFRPRMIPNAGSNRKWGLIYGTQCVLGSEYQFSDLSAADFDYRPLKPATFLLHQLVDHFKSAMTDRSEQIRQSPLGNSLDAVRSIFNSICYGVKTPCTADAIDELGTEGAIASSCALPL